MIDYGLKDKVALITGANNPEGIGATTALAFAREGARVIIVEKANCLGGAATNCLVNPFMPNATELSCGRVELSQGIFKEICDILASRGSIRKREFLEEDLKYVLNQMVIKEGIDLLFHAYIFKAKRNFGKIPLI